MPLIKELGITVIVYHGKHIPVLEEFGDESTVRK